MVIRSNIALQGDVLGAIVHYRHLKQQMILTCEWGWKKPAKRNPSRPLVLIASPVRFHPSQVIYLWADSNPELGRIRDSGGSFAGTQRASDQVRLQT